MTATAHAPARTSSVVIVTPHEIVTVGLRAMLAAEPASLRFLPPETEEVPDILLYDVVALLDDDGSTLDHWVREVGATVLALTRPLRPDLGTRALLLGAAAALPLSAPSTTVRAVVRDALARTLAEQNGASSALHHRRLGAPAGLSRRETDVLREVVNGLSNNEVADVLHLSINSVKTYIRSAYRKAGVTTRAQAVSWCVRQGFPPPPA